MASKFQQCHYEFLASFLAYERSVSTGENWDKDTERTKTIDGLARLLASRLANDNPKFKREWFLMACDVDQNIGQPTAPEVTYDMQLVAAKLLLVNDGRDALRKHASIGRDCGCGECFCCAAAEVLGKLVSDLEPQEVQ